MTNDKREVSNGQHYSELIVTIKEGWTLHDIRELVMDMDGLPGTTPIKAYSKLNGDLKTIKMKTPKAGDL